MKPIEQYIREKLGRPDAPADVDANDLWAGIEQQLPPGQRPAAAPWPWRTLFFGLLFLVLGGLITWSLLNDGTTDARTELASTAEDDVVTKNKNTTRTGAGTTATVAPAASAEGSISDREGKNVRSSLSNETQAESDAAGAPNEHFSPTPTSKRTRLTPAAAPTKRPSPKPNFRREIATAGSRPLPMTTQNEESSEEAPLATKENSAAPTPEPNSNRSPAATAPLPTPLVPKLQAAAVSFSLPPVAPAKPFKSTLSDRFAIGLNVGTNLLLTRYATPAEGPDALNAAVKPAGGGSFGLDLRYRLSNRFALSTGLEYHRTLNTFEHTAQRDTTVEHPSAFNSGPVDAIFSRRVADNLRTRFISVPVLLHWQKKRGNFYLGAGAGIGLNFRQSATGTTLTPNGTFAPFNAETGPAPTPEFFLSYHLSPTLAYRPKPESPLSLEAKADFRYSPFGVDELSGLKRNSLLAGFSIGFRYGL